MDGNYGRKAKVRDAVRGTLVAAFEGHDSELKSAAFSPDGTRVLTASLDGTAKLWSATRSSLLTTLEHAAGLGQVAFSRVGKHMVTGRADWREGLWGRWRRSRRG